jgi:hypothetical protein
MGSRPLSSQALAVRGSVGEPGWEGGEGAEEGEEEPALSASRQRGAVVAMSRVATRLWAALGPSAGDDDGAGGAAGARTAAQEAAAAAADPDALPVCLEAMALVAGLDPEAFTTLGSERGEKPLHLDEALYAAVLGCVRGSGGAVQCAALRLLHAWAVIGSQGAGGMQAALVGRAAHVAALVPACAAAVEANVAQCVSAVASGSTVYPYHAVVAAGKWG